MLNMLKSEESDRDRLDNNEWVAVLLNSLPKTNFEMYAVLQSMCSQ